MGPLAMAAIGAALGAAKNEAVDRPRADKQRKLAAETARYSGWTGMTPGPIKESDPFGNVLSGGMTGLSMSQNMQNQDAWNQFLAGQGGGSAYAAMNNPYQMNNNYTNGTMA
jgi:phosphoribosyl-dephospho-CoA transferase